MMLGEPTPKSIAKRLKKQASNAAEKEPPKEPEKPAASDKKSKKEKRRDQADMVSVRVHYNQCFQSDVLFQLRRKMEVQPDYISVCGGNLHPYQLEGLNWLR